MTADEVRALAAAAGLELPEERVEPVRGMLEAVLAEAAALEVLPLEDVEPMEIGEAERLRGAGGPAAASEARAGGSQGLT
jgi:Asp-tRNA(Asn)/Glu-tRNA(Gln) amidotransferase C subunit